ncbi:hypothetical protein H2198_008789 [Neophaeococcomyces mojaviensis]|uniref:Uncharacterized protein n=1 Tax=Neophaeococcomyces mojaviensis TaxID=3383035 RepID=A0ACC2ZWF7_9EURO|nr:hypothetical protein H2198_008789 [Knufia sp. JES_112]
MGGHAFEELGLYTPRIPASTYAYVLELVKQDLKDLFLTAESCIEAPEKKDHGDLDILVVPHPNKPVPSTKKIAEHLRADKWHQHQGSGMRHFAIPWPEGYYPDGSGRHVLVPAEKAHNTVRPRAEAIDRSNADFNQSKSADHLKMSIRTTSSSHGLGTEPAPPDALDRVPRKRHIQIDLNFLPSESSLKWALFDQAHGDMTNIISSIVRHKGLTLTDQALYLRIAGLESQNRKLARVELSRDPNQVLTFLGLDTDQFWKPFSTLNEMMRYIATCRFHDPKRLSKASADKRLEATRSALNTWDNKRLELRPAFAYWYNDFLPTHETDPPGAQAHLTREETLEYAFEFFGEEARRRYALQKRKVGAFVAKCRLWSDIRKEIVEKEPDMPEGDMHDTLKALKREIMPLPNPIRTPDTSSEEDISNSNLPFAHTLRSPQKAYYTDDLSTVIAWALENHAAALARYRQRQADSRQTVLDDRKANPFSRTELETYAAEDDDKIMKMKNEEKSWGQILAAIGKRSKSQLQAHWKNDLQKKVEEQKEPSV